VPDSDFDETVGVAAVLRSLMGGRSLSAQGGTQVWVEAIVLATLMRRLALLSSRPEPVDWQPGLHMQPGLVPLTRG